MEAEIGAKEPVSEAVIRAVSAVTGQQSGSLQPLNQVIDPQALDALFDSPSNDVHHPSAGFSFIYSSCRITIDNRESLTIEPSETARRPSAPSDGIDRVQRSRPNRDAVETSTGETPGSRVCFACQRPIDRDSLYRSRGELVHPDCSAELRCGIWLDLPPDL